MSGRPLAARDFSVTPAAAPFAVAAFALLLRLGLLWRTGFDGLYGQDPFAYLDYTAAFRAALAHAQVPPSFFWPIGYPAVGAALATFLPLSRAMQAVSIVCGVLIAVIICCMVREILGARPHALLAGLGAGLGASAAGQLLISSLCTMSDAASLFWATLSAFALLRFHRQHSARWVALAGLALGWAVMTRWVYALLIPVWGMALAAEVHEARPLLRAGVVAGVFLALALLPQALLMLKSAGTDQAAFMGDAQVYSWNPVNALRSDILNADGHFSYFWTVGAFYSLPFIEPDYVPLWFTPLGLLGIWALVQRRTELVLLLGWVVVMWAFLAGVEWENWRFPLAFYAPVAVLAGVGLGWLFDRAPIGSRRLLAVWLGAGLVVACAWGLYDTSAFIGRQVDERSIVSWLATRVPTDASILTFGETATLEHFTPYRVVELWSETPASVQAIARAGRDVFVLLDVENVESQWQGLGPQVNFQTLQDHFRLERIASRGAYVLYAVMNK